METVNVLDIDGFRWEMQDSDSRNKIALLETQLKQQEEEIKEKELKDYVLNPNVQFLGTIIQKGKLVIVSGTLLVKEKIEGYIIDNLPINLSNQNKYPILYWISPAGEILGGVLASLNMGSKKISLNSTLVESYPIYSQLEFSYLTA